MNEKIIIGRFGAAFGIHGWIKVISFTDPVDNILNYQPWFIEHNQGWQVFAVTESKWHGAVLLVKPSECENPEQARRYTNKKIAIEASQLPNLPANEYYWKDLEGCEVINLADENLGKVDHLIDTGPNTVLIVEGERQRLIPFIKDVIIKVDMAQKKIIVDWDSTF